ncbi:MAG: zeta toxin family protein, partial [Clostridia bacterium]
MDQDNLEKFTEEEFEKYKVEMYNKLTIDIEPDENPRAYILGGQSGSGKTTLHRIFKDRLKGNCVIINGDDFRQYHPRYKELKEKYGEDSVSKLGAFSGKMVEALVEDFSKDKYNLIVEGTLRTPSVPLETAEKLKDKGYSVELSVMAVKPQISYLSTIDRYEKMLDKGSVTRITPKAHHDNIVDKIADNLSEIYNSDVMDNISVYNRERECLYNQREIPNVDPGDVLENVLRGKWTARECDSLIDIIEDTTSLKTKRNAEDLEEYITNTKELL